MQRLHCPIFNKGNVLPKLYCELRPIVRKKLTACEVGHIRSGIKAKQKPQSRKIASSWTLKRLIGPNNYDHYKRIGLKTSWVPKQLSINGILQVDK